MIQPLQLLLLQQLTGNSPLSDFFKQPVSSSIQLPKINTMSSSASISAPAKSSFRFPADYSNPQETPESALPPGARFLTGREHQTLHAESRKNPRVTHLRDKLNPIARDILNENWLEHYHMSDSDLTSTYYTLAPLHPQDVKLPAGFRLLGRDEKTREGDHYVTQHFFQYNSDSICYRPRIGVGAEKAVDHLNDEQKNQHYCVAIARREEPTATPALLKVDSAVSRAIHNLHKISSRTGRAPKPYEVEAEMQKLVTAVETPLRTTISAQEVELKVLRASDDERIAKITELETKLKNAESKADSYLKGYTEKTEALRLAQAGARGNVVLLRRDGFSKPMEIAPSFSCDGYELPRYLKFYDQPEFPSAVSGVADISKVSYRTFTAVNTGKKDGFGRTIFEQV